MRKWSFSTLLVKCLELGRMKRLLGAGVGSAAAFSFYYLYQQQHSLPPVDAALQPSTVLRCTLREVKPVTKDTSLFRFNLPTAEHKLGLPTLSHVIAIDPANIYRAYTPVSHDLFDTGHFDLLIKRYPKGYFSSYVHAMNVGDTLEFKGPVVTLKYEPNRVKVVCMIAGGTGVTPMYQLLRTVLHNPKDETKVKLLYANKTVEDILLFEELSALAEDFPARFELRHVVESAKSLSKLEGKSPKAHIETGLIEADMIRGFFPTGNEEGVVVLVSGPDGMLRYLCGPGHENEVRTSKAPLRGLLKALGYTDGNVFAL